jgi:hypothetical protein
MLREKYYYDATSGDVVNRESGRVRKFYIGGTTRYPRVRIRFKGNLIALNKHTVVWLLCKVRWPVESIDHINGDRTDNRIENLRECSQSDNKLNMLLVWIPDRTTGLPGIETHGRKFRTALRGKKYNFSDPYEAFFYATICGKIYRKD